MKKLRIGFLAVIAVLAMSFTVAEHQGAFKKTSPEKKLALCLANDDDYVVPGNVYEQDCTPFTLTCDAPPVPVFAASNSPLSEGIGCFGDPEIFCCARLDRTQSTVTCNGQTAYKIVEVICRESE